MTLICGQCTREWSLLHVTVPMQALLVIVVYGDGALAVMISHEYVELRLHSLQRI